MLVLAAGIALVSPGGAAAAREPRGLADRPSQPSSGPVLSLGSKGDAVRALQKRLAWAEYLPWGSAIDGVFGLQTWHAVVAYQGWNGLSRDGVVGPATQAALAHAERPRAWSGTTGLEIHLAQQVMLLVRDKRVVLAVHVSTGRPGYPTPVGFFHVYERALMSWSVTFQAWMPLAQYFYGGYAVHEYEDVPAYPASHGCVRVPTPFAETVWNFGYIGIRVRIRGR